MRTEICGSTRAEEGGREVEGRGKREEKVAGFTDQDGNFWERVKDGAQDAEKDAKRFKHIVNHCGSRIIGKEGA